MARHILLTGFEPFAGDTVNPSGEVAKLLDSRSAGGCDVHSLVLPVQHEAARDLVAPALAAADLVAVVHLGLAGGRARISLERVAVNVMDYTRPDASGLVLRDVPCVADGPAAAFSTLPLRAMLAALEAEGIPAAVSNTAGTYLCNYALYTTLDALRRRVDTIPAGFVHLPFLPSMVAMHQLEEPSMELGLMVRAVEIVLGCAAAPVD
ncbi:MAG TPA: pyroglutamyl-peptidase I [Candidatus Methylomirabilis sp.]|nr:pyroglutamyl-peptidase I [Candidatus Methylomirabilis sp.]